MRITVWLGRSITAKAGRPWKQWKHGRKNKKPTTTPDAKPLLSFWPPRHRRQSSTAPSQRGGGPVTAPASNHVWTTPPSILASGLFDSARQGRRPAQPGLARGETSDWLSAGAAGRLLEASGADPSYGYSVDPFHTFEIPSGLATRGQGPGEVDGREVGGRPAHLWPGPVPQGWSLKPPVPSRRQLGGIGRAFERQR